jgi:hypothetical protein
MKQAIGIAIDASAGTAGLEPATSGLTNRCSAQLSYAPRERERERERERWKAGSAPRNRRQRRCRPTAPEPAVAHRHSCQRVSAPPPPHRLALEACRSQLHVRARALHQPLFRHFLDPPVGGSILHSAGGIRTHGLELMRLARTATPLPRKCGQRSLAGRIRTCDLRFPKPVGCPTPLRPEETAHSRRAYITQA